MKVRFYCDLTSTVQDGPETPILFASNKPPQSFQGQSMRISLDVEIPDHLLITPSIPCEVTDAQIHDHP